MNCINCGGEITVAYVHWGETKVRCNKCDLYFIYNNGSPFNTIEIVDKDHYGKQEVIQCNHEDRTWEKDTITAIGNGLKCKSTCMICGKDGYEYYKLDEFKVGVEFIGSKRGYP